MHENITEEEYKTINLILDLLEFETKFTLTYLRTIKYIHQYRDYLLETSGVQE